MIAFILLKKLMLPHLLMPYVFFWFDLFVYKSIYRTEFFFINSVNYWKMFINRYLNIQVWIGKIFFKKSLFSLAAITKLDTKQNIRSNMLLSINVWDYVNILYMALCLAKYRKCSFFRYMKSYITNERENNKQIDKKVYLEEKRRRSNMHLFCS